MCGAVCSTNTIKAFTKRLFRHHASSFVSIFAATRRHAAGTISGSLAIFTEILRIAVVVDQNVSLSQKRKAQSVA